MTTTSQPQAPDDGEDDASGSSEGAPGVELGMSDEPGSTFEPEEDAEPDA